MILVTNLGNRWQ